MNNSDGCNDAVSNNSSVNHDDSSQYDDDLSPTTRILMAESLAVMKTGKLKFREEVNLPINSEPMVTFSLSVSKQMSGPF